MGEGAIAACRPKKRKQPALLRVVRKRVPVKRKEGLATGRKPIVMWAADGTILEVFEWASARAIERAHMSPAVQTLWKEFEAACEDETLANLPEFRRLFPDFTPIDA